MEINFKNYVIENDKNLSFMLFKIEKTQHFKKQINERATVKNEYRKVRLGYYANLEQVLSKILHEEIITSDVKTIEELSEKLNEIHNDLKELKQITIKSIDNSLQ